jgi:hypothetical protein
MIDLRNFCATHRADLQTDTSSSDYLSIARAEKDALKYQNVVLTQLVELQAACSHTAQVFLRDLIPGAVDGTSHLFVSLKNDRQLHYEAQKDLEMAQMQPYGMHHIFQYMKKHTVRDDEVTQHVIEHDMLLHTRPSGMNIYLWALSFAPNIRRHRTVSKTDMSAKQEHMFVKNIFSAQITSNELETLGSIDKDGKFDAISDGKFDMIELKSLITKNLTRFNRTFKDDKRIGLFKNNHAIRMRPTHLKQDVSRAKRKNDEKPRKLSGPAPPAHKRQRLNSSASFLAHQDIPAHLHCKTAICIQTAKQHTHTTADCGYVKRDGQQGASRGASRTSSAGNGKWTRERTNESRSRTPANRKPIICHFCSGDHYKRNCAKFLKLQKSEQFMAVTEAYDSDELECLDLLICTTNSPVCKYCLIATCSGQCGEPSKAMKSAKEKFFSDGAYEQVLLMKSDHDNEFGHSPFCRDSYVSTQPQGESEGADSEDEPPFQENISIRPKPGPEDNEPELLHAGLDRDYESDKSSVDEDGNPVDL